MSDYLPQELIVKIFTNLPVKSLLRFRTLSKSWCSLISSPDFIRKYSLGLVKTTQKVLIMNNVICKEDIYTLHEEDRLPFSSSEEGYQGVTAVAFPRAEVRIAGSCNGILLLVDMTFGMCLWNFSIRRQLMIPRHPLGSKSSKMTGGFGFDPVSNDYKIMLIHYGIYGATLKAFVYALKTGSWSSIAPPAGRFYHLRCNSYLIDTTLYWFAGETPKRPHSVIMTFDLRTHVFGTISMPEPSWEIGQVGEYNGSVAVMCSKGKDPWIWVKKKESNDVSAWSVFLKLESPQFLAGPLLQLTSNGDLFIETFPDLNDMNSRLYNTRTGVLSTPLLRFTPLGNIRMTTYVESLELLDSGNPCGEEIKLVDQIEDSKCR